jgi:hypothetical protein
MLLVTPLDDLVRVHATSLRSLEQGYIVVRIATTLISAVAFAGPAALVLGRKLHGIEIPWITASAAAAAAAFILPIGQLLGSRAGPEHPLNLVIASVPPSLVFQLTSGVVTGCFLGLAQALVLRRYFRGGILWIAASISSYALAGVAAGMVSWQIIGAGTRANTSLTDFYAEAVAGALLSSLIVGLVTGLVLVHLLSESNRTRATAAV